MKPVTPHRKSAARHAGGCLPSSRSTGRCRDRPQLAQSLDNDCSPSLCSASTRATPARRFGFTNMTLAATSGNADGRCAVECAFTESNVIVPSEKC
jgi:hypothetical protein